MKKDDDESPVKNKLRKLDTVKEAKRDKKEQKDWEKTDSSINRSEEDRRSSKGKKSD